MLTWRVVAVQAGSEPPQLPAPLAAVKLVGWGATQSIGVNDAIETENVLNRTLEVLPVELTTRFIGSGPAAPVTGNLFYATSEAAAMSAVGENRPIVSEQETSLLCLARYYPADMAFVEA